MNKILKFLVLFIVILGSGFSFFSGINTTYATENLNIITDQTGDNNRNKLLKNFKDDNFFGTRYGGVKGTYGLMFRIAKDLKNIFFVLATLYFFIIVIKLLFNWDNEEGFTKFKKGILWITVGIFVMQSAYAYTKTLYNKSIGQDLGINLITNIVDPITGMLEMFASVIFLFMAIRAFFYLITAHGNEESVKKGKMTIVHAIIGFIFIKIVRIIIEGFYGKIKKTSDGYVVCKDEIGGILSADTTECLHEAEVTGFASTMLDILNRLNGFVGLIVVIMIIYAGVQILTSGGDEEKMKKAKKSVIYIAIGIFILFANYLILTFFIKPETLV